MYCRMTEYLAIVYFLFMTKTVIHRISNPDLWESYIILKFLPSFIFIPKYRETRSYVALSVFHRPDINNAVKAIFIIGLRLEGGWEGNSHYPNVTVFITSCIASFIFHLFIFIGPWMHYVTKAKQRWKKKIAIIKKISDIFIKCNILILLLMVVLYTLH